MRVHTLRSGIANIYIVETGNGVVIVDTGFKRAATAVLQTIAQLGYARSEVRLIFLTHAHVDHISSAAELRRQTGAPIALHQADVAKARAGKHNLPKGRGTVGKTLERVVNGLGIQFRYAAFEPDVRLDEGQTLRDFGWEAQVVATPGHSLGSLSLLAEDGVMFIGDAMINQIRVGMPLYGEDTALANDSARKLLGLRPQVLYSGHGAPFAGAEMERYFALKRLAVERANT